MMTWKPIDFNGIVTFDKPLYDQLDQFLYEREGLLGECIAQAIHTEQEDSEGTDKYQLRVKLSEALEIFEKKVHQISLSQQSFPTLTDFKKTISRINNCLWQYVETLDSCVVELFQQLNRLGLEKWHKEMAPVVNSIKILLMHRLQDLSWAIRRLETLLWQYFDSSVKDKEGMLKIKSWLPWSHLLDRHLLTDIEKSKKFLGFRHKQFTDRIIGYNKLYEKIDQNLHKFLVFRVFNTLDSNDQKKFKQVYELLRLWEYNQSAQALPKQDIINALREAQDGEKIFNVFRDYYHDLRNILYIQARLLKLGPEELWKDAVGKDLALEAITNHRMETRTLGATILRYRDFLLRTDPNPYVRSRWGFPEWIVGPEPAQCKRLLNLTYDTESLDNLYQKLQLSLEKGPSIEEDDNRLAKASQNIDHWMHGISQPLTSRTMMHSYIDHIVNQLVDLDELGSFNKKVMHFVGQVLTKILRVDWKYQVAFDIPKFKDVYRVHLGLVGHSEDRQHFNRQQKFKQIFQKIEEWAKKKTIERHSHEIEENLSDIKMYLQDFLVSIQKVVSRPKNDEEHTQVEALQKEFEGQLLEYRYQFGQFLHNLSQFETDERFLIHQFLFVYQYFEAIQDKINEINQY